MIPYHPSCLSSITAVNPMSSVGMTTLRLYGSLQRDASKRAKSFSTVMSMSRASTLRSDTRSCGLGSRDRACARNARPKDTEPYEGMFQQRLDLELWSSKTFTGDLRKPTADSCRGTVPRSRDCTKSSPKYKQTQAMHPAWWDTRNPIVRQKKTFLHRAFWNLYVKVASPKIVQGPCP